MPQSEASADLLTGGGEADHSATPTASPVGIRPDTDGHLLVATQSHHRPASWGGGCWWSCAASTPTPSVRGHRRVHLRDRAHRFTPYQRAHHAPTTPMPPRPSASTATSTTHRVVLYGHTLCGHRRAGPLSARSWPPRWATRPAPCGSSSELPAPSRHARLSRPYAAAAPGPDGRRDRPRHRGDHRRPVMLMIVLAALAMVCVNVPAALPPRLQGDHPDRCLNGPVAAVLRPARQGHALSAFGLLIAVIGGRWVAESSFGHYLHLSPQDPGVGPGDTHGFPGRGPAGVGPARLATTCRPS